MRASLADQADAVAARLLRSDTLAIALGANLPSPAGEPADTLLAVRPHLEQALQHWAMAVAEGARSPELLFQWSPLVRTAPVGGPPGQSDYTNGVVLVALPAALAVADPDRANARLEPQLIRASLSLLQRLQQLEAQFGRPPLTEREPWGPRSLDLDWLWWGNLELRLQAAPATPALQLPHPLWRQRTFVVEPLMTLIAGA